MQGATTVDQAGEQQAAQHQQDVEPEAGDETAAAAPLPAGSDEDEEFDSDLAAWLAGKLQRMQPGAELTVGSVKVLGRLLDEITMRVLDEARQVGSGEAAAPDAAAGAALAQPQPPHERRGKQQQHKTSALTSLDIHKALKRVLPGEAASTQLRPYLPAVTKQAWHLDKQSLKGIKRQKQAASGAAADDGGARSKENDQQQQQQAAPS